MIFQCSIDIHRSRPTASEFRTWPGVVSRFNLSAFNHYRTGLMTRPQSGVSPVGPVHHPAVFPWVFGTSKGRCGHGIGRRQCSTDVQRLRGGVCVPSSSPAWKVLPLRNFNRSGMSFRPSRLIRRECHHDYGSFQFWHILTLYSQKKHLEVFKFDFEKNEMPNVSSVESSVDARSTL